MIPINADKMVYADVEFIALKYEEIKNITPSTQLTRTEGKQAGLSITIASAKVHTQETRTYSLSTFGMLKEIFENLKSYPAFSVDGFDKIESPIICWVEGHVTVSIWKHKEDELQNSFTYFQLLDDIHKKDFSLLTVKEYTSSGYNNLFDISPAIQNSINIPVNVLLKILYYSDLSGSYVATPVLILER